MSGTRLFFLIFFGYFLLSVFFSLTRCIAFSVFFEAQRFFVKILSVAIIVTDKWNRLADYRKSMFLCRLMSDYTKLQRATVESVFFFKFFLITSINNFLSLLVIVDL